MKMRVIHEDKRSIEFSVEDIDISVLQILQSFLFKDERVKNVAFRQTHPVLKTMNFWVEVSKDDPRKIITKACKRAIEEVNNLKDEISAALEGKEE